MKQKPAATTIATITTSRKSAQIDWHRSLRTQMATASWFPRRLEPRPVYHPLLRPRPSTTLMTLSGWALLLGSWVGFVTADVRAATCTPAERPSTSAKPPVAVWTVAAILPDAATEIKLAQAHGLTSGAIWCNQIADISRPKPARRLAANEHWLPKPSAALC